MSNSSFTFCLYDITRFIRSDYTPVLKRISFSELVNAGTYGVPTENTYTNDFSIKYPQYSSIIDNASNPSLSADYYVTKITLGKTWGIFYPSGDKHRWATIGIGARINYIEEIYSINVCDPYLLSSEVHSPVSLKGEFREGFCKKNELYSTRLNRFYYEFNLPIKVYSYIGETFELNILKLALFTSLLSHYLKSKSVIIPTFLSINTLYFLYYLIFKSIFFNIPYL